ncbi:alpha-hydroxy acid oxidase [Denitromonas iodatirespirans]|uniref:Alpha-hydroxy-acid oxidizing protein n=1 Tax=Denitromonas iodatirespirans TaxID=2795389 RepID=A0A944D8T0_DENI1|nr:alpha-hydroxy acid oxidase [Denitromonas iodatirespirans]MBT0960456.1 alpha-hydroxy-acid oxidizing protein [Denitromonas iodatirespirans]
MTHRPPPLERIPREIAAVTDYEAFARERLDDNAWAYLNGAAADELSARWNREAFERLRLESRVLAEVAGGHTRLELFGQPFAHPVMLAPLAYQRLAHPHGELASAMAASAMAAGMVVSTLASASLEEIAAASEAPLWFQLYVQPDPGANRALIERAEAAGYRALVITVDAPINGVRNREQRAGFHLPAGVEAVNLHGLPTPAPRELAPDASIVFDGLMARAPTWRDIARLREHTRLPVLLKGVMSVADARQAQAIGIDGLIVSNHGGRVLDTLPASLDALPPIAEAVGNAMPLLLDGGIRRGTDVFKALALGARAVLIGRPYAYALAAAGALGVAHVLKLLREELEVAMALTGCATLADIDRSRLA